MSQTITNFVLPRHGQDNVWSIGHGKIRLFHGYFGENSDLAYVLFVGENAVLYQKIYE